MQDGGKVVLGLGVVAGIGALIYAATRKVEAAPPPEIPPEVPPEVPPEEEAVIDAEFRSGYTFWAALLNWQRVYTTWVNEWPADTDMQFAWEIKNIGNAGAYFQVYAFTPGAWYYLDPGEKVKVYENYHTPTIPVTPGYQYCRITILGRKISGERIGAVWTSNEFEIIYV